MEDQSAAPTDSSSGSSNIVPPTVVEAVEPQPRTEPTNAAEVKLDADPVQSTEQNPINNIQVADPIVNTTIESVDQTLDRAQEQKNSAVIVENSEKNDESSSTTSDDSDDESSSSSMHLGLEDKKSKMHDLDEDEDPADNKPIRSVNELKVRASIFTLILSC